MRWLRLSSVVGVSQVAVQGISALTGLMLVRALSKADYALITIAGSMLATISLLADGGIGSAITAMSGRAVPDRAAVSSAIRACLVTRNRLAWLSLFLTLPPFYWLLTSTGLSAGGSLLLLGLGAITVWPSTDAKFLAVPLRIMGRVHETQQIDMAGGAVRFLLTGAVILVGFGKLMPAFVATVSATWVQSWLVHRSLRRQVDLSIPASDQDIHEVNTFVRSLYANHIFFCIQGQIATWIISWTSGTDQIADIGALGRLAVIFSILAALYHYLVMPNLATTRSARQLRWKFCVTFVATLGAVMALIAAAWLFPQPLLWILGGAYGHLDHELLLVFAAQGVAFANSILWIFLQMRGWIEKAWLNIPLTLLGYALSASLFPMNTVAGVLMMTGVACLPPLAWVSFQCWRRLAREIYREDHGVVDDNVPQ
jgi:O-antigen/teichoic acid export membrane protein